MAQVLQPVGTELSNVHTGTPGKEDLIRSIDDLLEHYLHLLDQYQTLQKDIGHQSAAGFLSLAQANFSSPYRLRYGQDYYDERMKATTQVSVKASNPVFSVSDTTGTTGLDASMELESEKSGGSQPQGTDPLRWFGILVPPPLKACQKEFEGAVRNVLPHLANVTNEMKEIEIEVRRTRKKLKKLG